MATSKERAETRLFNSIYHRLVSYKPHSNLSGYNRDLRVLQLSHCVREWRPSWLAEMNHVDLELALQLKCPDQYRRACLRRDRFWALLLKLQG